MLTTRLPRLAAVNRLLMLVDGGRAVSADEASMVSVWDADSGERIIQFVGRQRVLPDGTELPVAVTAMRFDGSMRRLVVAFSDGCVRTFNFNNGAVLRQVRDTPPSTLIHCRNQTLSVDPIHFDRKSEPINRGNSTRLACTERLYRI